MMKNGNKRLIAALLVCMLFCGSWHDVCAAPSGEQQTKTEIAAVSAILMEASTGQVICDKNPDEKLPPASVTKVMTMLLIFDALEAGEIGIEDSVTVSEFAASMGGSQVYLEPGETQTVDTMLKCIAVASANDACVAMAEYICGSEEEFVRRMNERANGLGMKNTHFVNCNGLDADGHLTTARDIALMSRELITKYPKIHDYSTIWMENITHTTKKGSSEFGLANTNKLIRHYEYATGLKTGSTSKAKFCLSATAEKDGIELIAVVMACPDSKQRVKDAIALLNRGFGTCRKYTDDGKTKPDPVKVKRGVKKEVRTEVKEKFTCIDITGADLSAVKKKVTLKKSVTAPVRKGMEVGTLTFSLDGKELGRVPVVAKERVKQISYGYAAKTVFVSFLL